MGTQIPFQYEFNFEYETVEELSPLIRRIVARNPNFFTFYGTNTYILGRDEVALVDPGPDQAEHIEAITSGLKGETVTHILITHSHFDHWPAAVALQSVYNAPSYGYRPDHSTRGASGNGEDISELSNQERFDFTGFIPDIGVSHGEIISGKNWQVECVFTPGHASNHMCYQLQQEKALLSGDHVMGWSTSVISPPSGNMEDYMNSLHLLLERDDRCFWPAHGTGIDDPRPFVRAFIAHREEREQEIIEQLQNGVTTIRRMVPHIYRDVPEHLHPAAERSTLAAVLYMIRRGTISCNGEATVTSELRLIR